MKFRLDGGERLSREAIDRTAQQLVDGHRRAGQILTHEQARRRVAAAVTKIDRRQRGE